MLPNQLQGTGVALITPFNAQGQVSYSALETMIDFVINGGVNYIVSLGTTGEAPTLTLEEKKTILHYTFEKVNQRVPVVVGIGGNNTHHLIEELHTLPIDKAIAVLSTSPYYNKPSQEGLYQHYKALAEASSKPVILYNVPGRTGRNIDAATVIRLAHEVKNIAGIKEAGENMMQCMEIVKNRPSDFLVVSGDDALILPQMACGVDGIISVAANAFPAPFSSMIRYGLAQNFSKARAIHYDLLEMYKLLFIENNPAGLKAFLFEMGLIENYLRLPLTPLSAPYHQKVKEFLSQYKNKKE